MFDEKFKNIITNFHYEIAQEQMKKEFIMRDMGIGFIIEDEVEDELKKGSVVKVNMENATVEGSVGAITLNEKYATFATKKLLDYIKR